MKQKKKQLKKEGKPQEAPEDEPEKVCRSFFVFLQIMSFWSISMYDLMIIYVLFSV